MYRGSTRVMVASAVPAPEIIPVVTVTTVIIITDISFFLLS